MKQLFWFWFHDTQLKSALWPNPAFLCTRTYNVLRNTLPSLAQWCQNHPVNDMIFFFHYRRSEYEEVRFIVALLLLRLLSSFFFPNIAVFTLVSKTHWFCITMQYTIGFKKSRHFRSYSFSRALPHVFTSSFDWLIELFLFWVYNTYSFEIFRMYILRFFVRNE